MSIFEGVADRADARVRLGLQLSARCAFDDARYFFVVAANLGDRREYNLGLCSQS